MRTPEVFFHQGMGNVELGSYMGLGQFPRGGNLSSRVSLSLSSTSCLLPCAGGTVYCSGSAIPLFTPGLAFLWNVPLLTLLLHLNTLPQVFLPPSFQWRRHLHWSMPANKCRRNSNRYSSILSLLANSDKGHQKVLKPLSEEYICTCPQSSTP